MYPVTLAGRVVALREFRHDDAASAYAVVGDDRVTNWLSYDSRDLDQATQMIDGAIERAQNNPRSEYYLAIEADHQFVGFCRLGLDGVKAAKLGYSIQGDQWDKGYATDAARTLTDFGFRTLGLHRVSAAMSPDNAASVSVAKHLGMTYEGRIRDHVFTNGAWRDSLLYSVLEDEWRRNDAAGARRELSLHLQGGPSGRRPGRLCRSVAP